MTTAENTTPMGRKKKDPIALANARANKAAARKFRNRYGCFETQWEADKVRHEWEDKLAQRMIKRFYNEPFHILKSNWNYWRARRCGWDALDPRLLYAKDGTPVVDPSEGWTWIWWTKVLHWTERQEICATSNFRLTQRK